MSTETVAEQALKEDLSVSSPRSIFVFLPSTRIFNRLLSAPPACADAFFKIICYSMWNLYRRSAGFAI